MMRVLREVRWRCPVQPFLAQMLLHIFWLQYFTIQMDQQHIHFVMFLQDFLHVFSGKWEQLALFFLHLIILLLLFFWTMSFRGGRWESIWNKFNFMSYFLSYTYKCYPYVFFITILNSSLSGILTTSKNNIDIMYLVFCAINFLCCLCFTFSYSFFNTTLQFVQMDYLVMRSFEPITVMLQTATLVCNTILQNEQRMGLYCLNITLAVLKTYQQLKKFEYETVRRWNLFYCFTIGFISVILLIQKLTGKQIDSKEYLFVQLCAVYLSWILSHRLNSTIKLTLPSRLVTAQDYEQLIRQYQIAHKEHMGDKTDKSYLAYLYYNIVVQHYARCQNAQCRCRKKSLARQLTAQDEQKIFILENLRLLEMAQVSLGSGAQIRLLEIYFHLEIAKEPIKAYYEIIRLKREKTAFRTRLELESMIEMARLCFSQIFRKNNVKNQELTLLKLIEYQQNIEQLEIALIQALNRQSQFLKLFTYHSIKISDVQEHTRNIESGKQKIQQLMDLLSKVNCQQGTLNLFNYIYYKFLEFYRSKRLQFQKMRSQEQIKKRLFDKSEVDIFGSQHGTIYIDLIEQRGKILKITRNVCQMFGYPKNEMVEMNIDGYMPSIFARCHDKFLTNFIEKGEITLLKEKQRVIFGKNKKHFIFPFNIRLKVQNTNEGAFGACALITKLNINKQYILFGKKGCVDQVSQGIYQKIFQPLLQGDVSRVSRLNMLKLMPSLNTLIESSEQNNVQLMQGTLLMPLQFQQLVKFRFHRRVENETAADVNSDRFDRMSFNASNQMSLDSRKAGDKVDTRYIESFKSFVQQVDFLQLKGYLVSYRLSQFVTAYFQAKVLEIENIRELPIDKKFFLNVIDQLKNVATFLNIHDQFSPWVNKLNTMEKVIGHFSLSHLLKVGNGANLVSQYEQILSNNVPLDDQNNPSSGQLHKYDEDQVDMPDQDAQEGDYCSSMSQMRDDVPNQAGQGLYAANNSQQSSVVGNEQQQNKKQLIIQAFSKDRSHGIPPLVISFGLLTFLLIILIALAMFLVSIYITSIEKNSWRGTSTLIKYSQTLSYHNAFTELVKFYNSKLVSDRATEIQSFIEQENKRYISLFKNMSDDLLSANFDRKSQQLKKTFTLANETTGQNISLDFFNLVHEVQVLMLLGGPRYELIRQNQIKIQNIINSYIQDDLTERISYTHTLQLICLITFIAYQVLLILVGIVSLPIYNYFKQRRMFLLSLLGYFNIRDIRKSMNCLKNLQDILLIANDEERNDKIMNAMNQTHLKRSHTSSLKEEREEIEKMKGKSMKLSYQGLKDTKGTFICIVVLGLLFLSVYPTCLYAFNKTEQNTIEQILMLQNWLYKFDGRVPLLLSTVLTNINNQNSTIQMDFDDSAFYEIRIKLAEKEIDDQDRTKLMDDYLVGNICSKINIDLQKCQKMYGGMLTRGYFYSMQQFKDKLKRLRQFTSASGKLKQEIDENKILDFLQQLRYLRLEALQVSNQMLEMSLKHITQYVDLLIEISCALFFFSLLCFWMLKSWTISRLREIIKGTEKIYLNFSINILMENTYLTSYFNSKVRLKI